MSTEVQTQLDGIGTSREDSSVAALLGATALNQVATQTRVSIKKWSLAQQPEPGLFTQPSRNQQEETSLPTAGQLQPATNNQVPACFNPYSRGDLRLTNPFSISCLTRNSDSFLFFVSALCSSPLPINPSLLFHLQKSGLKREMERQGNLGDMSRGRSPHSRSS